MFEAMLRSSLLRGFSILLLGLALAGPALGQPSNTCDGTESLSGTDTLPQMLNLTAAAMTDTFTMTGPGCIDQPGGDDMVVCFTPQNSCTVDISCFYTPAGGGTTAANLFQGACSTNPATCISSTSGGGTQTIVGASLTMGTQYCVVCSNNISITSLDVSIVINSGDCGALPVDLQRFSVDSQQSSTLMRQVEDAVGEGAE